MRYPGWASTPTPCWPNSASPRPRSPRCVPSGAIGPVYGALSDRRAADRGPRRRAHADAEPAGPQERPRTRELWVALADALRDAKRDTGRARTGAHRRRRRVLLGCRHPAPVRTSTRATSCDRLTDVALALHELAMPTDREGHRRRRRRRAGTWRWAATWWWPPRVAVLPDLLQARPVGGPGRFVAAAEAGRAAAGQAPGAAGRHDRRRGGTPLGSGHLGDAERRDRRLRRRSGRRGWPRDRRSRSAQSKALLNDGADATLREALANEARAQPGNFATADSAEAYAAFAAKRDAEFSGRWAVPARGQKRATREMRSEQR